jgi:hypothetical protein
MRRGQLSTAAGRERRLAPHRTIRHSGVVSASVAQQCGKRHGSVLRTRPSHAQQQSVGHFAIRIQSRFDLGPDSRVSAARMDGRKPTPMVLICRSRL